MYTCCRLSVNAIACMGGFLHKDGDKNEMMMKTLNALITPYLTKQLIAGCYAEVCLNNMDVVNKTKRLKNNQFEFKGYM